MTVVIPRNAKLDDALVVAESRQVPEAGETLVVPQKFDIRIAPPYPMYRILSNSLQS